MREESDAGVVECGSQMLAAWLRKLEFRRTARRLKERRSVWRYGKGSKKCLEAGSNSKSSTRV